MSEIRQTIRFALEQMYPGGRVIALQRPEPPRTERVQLLCTCDHDAVLSADKYSCREVMLRLRYLTAERRGQKVKVPFWAEQCSRCSVVYFYVYLGEPRKQSAPTGGRRLVAGAR